MPFRYKRNYSKFLLFIIVVIVVVLFPTSYSTSQEKKQLDISFHQIKFHLFNEKFKSKQNLQILDVRTVGEYINGHIPGALLFPVQDLESSKDLSKISTYFNKNEELYIYCTAGGPRSQRATQILRKLGFEKIYFVEGGISRWILSGNPIVKNGSKWITLWLRLISMTFPT